MDVEPRFKSDMSTPGHPRGCACKPCVGRRSRRSGKKKQGDARKVIEQVTKTHAHWRGHLANEESWSHLPIRIEVKSGARFANPVWTRYRLARAQSDASHALGSTKPFAAILMPVGTGNGLFVCQLDELQAVIEALS